ncbi:MAG TPA: DUF2252 family protein, partial [Bdellovibrionales bacterium]|nr:DUF2252 family protein [Bdellovibrionales bacterium]
MASHSNILMATALVSSLLFGCAGQVHAKTPAFTQVKESKGELSKLLRSNTRHFWASMKETEYQGPMSKYLSYEGVITGDPHFGNFALIPLIDKKGKETLEFANIDFDDAGIGPFAFDFVRLVVATKAIEFDLNDSEDKFARVGEMVRAYADGLEGEEVATPDL